MGFLKRLLPFAPRLLVAGQFGPHGRERGMLVTRKSRGEPRQLA
jgi:hypothetical protein